MINNHYWINKGSSLCVFFIVFPSYTSESYTIMLHMSTDLLVCRDLGQQVRIWSDSCSDTASTSTLGFLTKIQAALSSVNSEEWWVIQCSIWNVSGWGAMRKLSFTSISDLENQTLSSPYSCFPPHNVPKPQSVAQSASFQGGGVTARWL